LEANLGRASSKVVFKTLNATVNMDFTLNRFALLTFASIQNNLPSSGRRHRKQYLKMSWNYSTPPLSSGDSVMLVLKAHDGPQLGISLCRAWS
jgi:hypothetical protein